MDKNFSESYKISNFENLGIDNNYNNKQLSNIWFIENPIDVEYKYYILMDFIQNVEKNVQKGYLYKEYIKLNNIYKDLQCFKTSFDIVNKDTQSEKLIKYIYNLPPSSDKVKEIIKTVDKSLELVSDTYMFLLNKITEFYDNAKVTETFITDRRKSIYFYIEKCNSGIYEIFELKKSGIVIDKGFCNKSEKPEPDNFIIIETNFAYNSIGTTLPFSIYEGD
jgi:hypothetical protein